MGEAESGAQAPLSRMKLHCHDIRGTTNWGVRGFSSCCTRFDTWARHQMVESAPAVAYGAPDMTHFLPPPAAPAVTYMGEAASVPPAPAVTYEAPPVVTSSGPYAVTYPCNHMWPQRSRTWGLLRLLLRLFYVLDRVASSPAVTSMSEAVKVAKALAVTYFGYAASNVLSLGKDFTSICSHMSFMTDLHATRQVRALFGTWCALPVFAEFGKRPDLLFLMSADRTVRELQSLNGAVQTRIQVATRTILPDITRLAEKHHQFFLGERICECSSCARICSSTGTVYFSLQLTPRLCCPLFFCFFLAARHPADIVGVSYRWCGTDHVIFDVVSVPLRASIALQSAALALVSMFS